MKSRPPIACLTSLRFFAALGIGLHHAADQQLVPTDLVRSLNLAQGVSFFFVLSGFILGYVYLGQELSSRSFYTARLARIWPATLTSLLLVLLLVPPQLLLIPGSWLLTLGSLLASLLMLQSLVPLPVVYFGFNAVAWSVSTEACFYAIFPWVLRCLRKSWLLVLLVSVGSGMAMVVVAQCWKLPAFNPRALESVSWHGLIYIHPLARFQEFLFGLLAAMLFLCTGLRSRAQRLLHGGGEVLALLFFLIAMWAFNNYLSTLVQLSPPFALLIFQWGHGLLFAILITILAFEAGWFSRMLRWSPLVALGEISFSFYLLHQMLLIVLVHVHPQLLAGLPNQWRIFPILLLALLLAYVQWRWLEQPARKFWRRRAKGTNAANTSNGP